MKAQRAKTPRKKANKPTDPVEVYCRLRPNSRSDDEGCCKVISTTVIQLSPPEKSVAVRNGEYKETQYTFQHLFDHYTSQKAMFDYVAMPLVDDLLNGKNALLFAYGITSSGKTHTMTGVPQDQGILPRCLDVIFNSIGDLQSKKYVFKPDKMNGFDVQTEAGAMLERQRRDLMPKLAGTPRTPGTPKIQKETADSDRYDMSKMPRVRDPSRVEGIEEDNTYAVFVSYVEIYNNYIYDLLEELPCDPITGLKAPNSKILREDMNHMMYVHNVVEIEVKSTEEAYEVLWRGQKRRKVAHTTLNTESSRSHSVFNIRLVQAPLDPIGEEVMQDKDKICVSQLALVDLAGSERTGRTGNAGDRLREAGNINQSLMVLRTCIEALRENQKSNANKMVPYRDSRLTHLFKNYFDGEGKVRMIVCVNPSSEEYDETVHVMRFAEMTQEVRVARPQQVRFDMGFTPGRRRMNKKYKEAVAKVVEEGGDLNDIPIPAALVYSLGPQFPMLQVLGASDSNTLIALQQFLKDREVKRTTLLSDFTRKQDEFRAKLIEVVQENTALKQQVLELEATLEAKDVNLTKTERRLKSLEKNNVMLQRTATLYEQDRKDLQNEIEHREWKIHREKSEKDRLRQDYKAKLVLTEHQYNRQIEMEKKRINEQSKAAIRQKQQKLDMVKNILNCKDSDTESTSSGSSQTLPKRPPVTRYQANTGRIFAAKSEPDLTASGTSAMMNTPKSVHTRAMTQTLPKAPRTAPRPAPRPRARSPPPIKPKPVVNPRHRRSKSSNADIWLDHKPVGSVEPGTLYQPKMKKKRSVTKLNEKDTKTASKYCLTHQTMDSDGEMATKLIKGSIVPTAGGGSAVIFSDVETLKQTSPGDRKRRSPQPQPEDFEGEWTDTEDRCRIAIVGHGSSKRPKVSVV